MKTLIIACLLAATAFSQTPQPAPQIKYFHLDFVIRELDNEKVLSTRNYSTTVTSTGEMGSIRIGDKVPLANGKDGAITYMDIGVRISAQVQRVFDDKLSMKVYAEISSVFGQTTHGPALRSVQWDSALLVPLKKPTIIYSSDATTEKKQIQLELTVTPVE